jgi:hypothetical protein
MPRSDRAPAIRPEPLSPARVARRLRELLERGARLRPAGTARRRPTVLLGDHAPRHLVRFFDTSFYLTDYRHDEAVGFLVGYLVQGEGGRRPVRSIWPRIFYKDSSLVWRVASHFVHDEHAFWIGKGDVRYEERADGTYQVSAEETTNLPWEVQAAFDEVSRRRKKRYDERAIPLVVREAPSGRVRAYRDFLAPRERETRRIHGGRPIARFTRRGDPASLRFTPGFEPDLDGGVVERFSSASAFFGGRLDKFRVLSTNGRIQYLFFSAPRHVWLCPPQALTTDLSTFGVRTVDVLAPDDLFVPGYEYHEDGDSQIPEGYAGAPHPDGPARADASAWLDALPVIRAFRAKVLGRRRVTRRAARRAR